MNRAEALPYYLRDLAAFKEMHGHTNVPRTYEADEELAAWVRRTREAWRQDRLHDIHIQKLTEAGFCFAPLDEAWQTQYQSLVAYVRDHGDAKVPRDYQDHSLAVWVMHQRAANKQGKLTADELRLLNEVKFIFEPQDHQWAENMARLAQFKVKHQHALVPRRYPEDTKLADFSAGMRKRFKANKLSESQINDLIAADFVFDPIDAVWSANLSEYATWRATSGTAVMPPRRIAGKPTTLYEWCRIQLKNLKEGRMPEARVARLLGAGFAVTTA